MEWDAYRDCCLCPRHCGADRLVGRTGFCGEPAVCRVASVGAHHGEEPCFSGQQGSGTVFFSGCSCGCFFCQNHQISHEHLGDELSLEQLVGRIEALVALGVHNVNFVTPDHFQPHVLAACRQLRAAGVDIPFLYNCSGYMADDRVAELAEVIDIFLPDFKFAAARLAQRCLGDPRYAKLALAAITAMIDAVGFLTPWDETGEQTARRGVLVRHLVLPGEVANSLGVLEHLHERFGPNVPLSVMSQYRPTRQCQDRGTFARTVSSEEYERVCDRVLELGFKHVFIQPDFGDGGFLPDFAEDEPFAGNRPS
jgi:putative pyruvate formate lyase activating enzyme